MAEAPLSNTLVDDFLTCQICFEVFKDPRILQCLHTFCLECLTKLHKGSAPNVFKCPTCRNDVVMPKPGISGLKVNFYINNLIDVVRAKDVSSTAKDCSFCAVNNESREASYMCLECQDSLCQTCADRHNFTRLTMKHRVVKLDEVCSGYFDDQIRSLQEVECQTHKGESIRYFCETCDELVCRDCVILSHKTHKCISSEEALKNKIGGIKDLITILEHSLENQIKVESDLYVQLSDMQKLEENEYLSVALLANKVVSKVRLEENKAKENISEKFQSSKEKLSDKIKAQRDKSETMRHSLETCRNILHKGKDVEILYLQGLLHKRLEELQKTTSSSSDLIFDFRNPKVRLHSSFESDLQLFEYYHSSPVVKSVVPDSYSKLTESPQTPKPSCSRHINPLRPRDLCKF